MYGLRRLANIILFIGFYLWILGICELLALLSIMYIYMYIHMWQCPVVGLALPFDWFISEAVAVLVALIEMFEYIHMGYTGLSVLIHIFSLLRQRYQLHIYIHTLWCHVSVQSVPPMHAHAKRTINQQSKVSFHPYSLSEIKPKHVSPKGDFWVIAI